VAEDEDERLTPGFRESLELDPSLDPTLEADELELEELGAQFDSPERMVTMAGGMDDPDGLDRPPERPLAAGEEGWDLGAPLAAAHRSDEKAFDEDPDLRDHDG
jgi:hypothetical protein